MADARLSLGRAYTWLLWFETHEEQVVELMLACLSPCSPLRGRESKRLCGRRTARAGGRGLGHYAPAGTRCSCLSLAPALNYFDIHLHGHPLGVVGAEAGVENLIHPGDHDLLHEHCPLLGLLLGALEDNLIVDGEDGDRPEALFSPLVEERKGEL